MNSFEDREKSFEKKFAHDEELQFKISARKNKYLGEWASKILGFDQDKEYIKLASKRLKNTKQQTKWVLGWRSFQTRFEIRGTQIINHRNLGF